MSQQPKPIWILDSGAYSVKHSGAEISLEEYAGFVRKYGDKFEGGCIVLDVIGDRVASYENWHKLKKLGAETIPVFHLILKDKNQDDGYAYLDKYLDETDYVCISGFPGLTTQQVVYILDSLWNHLAKRGADKTHKFHGLGLTRLPLMAKYPWFSVDSASASKQGLNGGIYVPHISSYGAYRYMDANVFHVSDQQTHLSGSDKSFYALAPDSKLREGIIRYCQEMGYPLPDTIEGRVLRPRRKYPGEDRSARFDLGFAPQANDVTTATLANDYKMRESLNFGFFHRFLIELRAEQNHKLRIYHALSGDIAQIHRCISRAHTDGVQPTMLISYWYLTQRTSCSNFILGEKVKRSGSEPRGVTASPQSRPARAGIKRTRRAK